MELNLSLAALPGLRHTDALRRASEMAAAGTLADPVLGALSMTHVQLVPQSFGLLCEGTCANLRAAAPATRFRLHANVRVLPTHRLADLSGFDEHQDWFAQAARISRALGAEAYVAHAGARSEASMNEMLDDARRTADLFGCLVGVEGQFATRGDALLVSSWAEYRQVFESGVPYALDLSHLHIVACHSGVREDTLVAEMLVCERCIEVHVSDNDGSGDWHQVCRTRPWWHPLLQHIHPGAVVFYEGNLRRPRKDQP